MVSPPAGLHHRAAVRCVKGLALGFVAFRDFVLLFIPAFQVI